jgi:hypothetical protein
MPFVSLTEILPHWMLCLLAYLLKKIANDAYKKRLASFNHYFLSLTFFWHHGIFVVSLSTISGLDGKVRRAETAN